MLTKCGITYMRITHTMKVIHLNYALFAGLIMSLCLFNTNVVFAAPNVSHVSSTLSHGNTVTITGSGFGTKNHAAPLLWKDFEDRIVGAKVGGNDGWTTPSLNPDVKYNGTLKRTSVSNVNVKAHFVYDSVRSMFQRSVYPPVHGKKMYSYWWYVDKMQDSSGNTAQLKGARLSAGPGHSDQPSLHYGFFIKTDGSLHNFRSGLVGVPTVYRESSVFHPPTTLNKWARMTVFVDESDMNKANGVWSYEYFQNGVKKTFQSVPIVTQSTNTPLPIKWLNLGYAVVNAPKLIIDTYWDDIYADDSWSRVELCNASKYSASTLCEIQIPSTWNNSSINIRVNKGSFPNGSAYLYVFDQDGVPNTTGFSVTIGGGDTINPTPTEDTTPPAVPTGLRVQ